MADKFAVLPQNAVKMKDWLATRGGVAVWRSVDLSDPGFSIFTPAKTPHGDPYPKPHWKVGHEPLVVTDPAAFDVIQLKEHKRFRIGVRMGAQGLSLKVTDGGSRRIRKELERAGDGATYDFDYATQEAVIRVPEGPPVPLADWKE